MPLLAIILTLCFLAFPAFAQERIIAEETEEELVEESEEPEKIYTGVKLRGLNKITTRVEEIEAVMGAVTRFGNLEVIPRGCWVAPPSERPEQAGLLEVWYWKQGEKPSLVFYGWMFANSPALSSLEHPVYDITMLECVEQVEELKEEAEIAEEAEEAE